MDAMTPPKPTSELFKDAVAFDRDAIRKDLEAKGYTETNNFFAGEWAVRKHDERLRPILESVGKVIEAADSLINGDSPVSDCVEQFYDCRAALADLRAAVLKEGK